MKLQYSWFLSSTDYRLFSEYPQYKNIWPQFRDIPDSSLMFSNELRKHVNVYGKGMNQIINALHSEKELYVILRKLAKAHAKKAVFKAHVMVGQSIVTLYINYLFAILF